MELSTKLLTELQRRLKVGNRRGVHLNAIPAKSRYKFDLSRLAQIDPDLPSNFIEALLTKLPLAFSISWKNIASDLGLLLEEDQAQLVKITKSLENLINQTEAIEQEKGVNTFGFGFPILARRDRDNKLTIAPILIWSLRIKRTNQFNTWEIKRTNEDPIYLNEVLINHLQMDASVVIEQIPNDMLDDGLIGQEDLIQVCCDLLKAINAGDGVGTKTLLNTNFGSLSAIGDKVSYEKRIPPNSTTSIIDFGGIFSIFEVQKQNIIKDYEALLKLPELSLRLDDLEQHSFQPISSIDTDPSQQSVLHSLESRRNLLIQGPPGTGKSQTLTAILVNALENQRKTIVVCEKITALDVLHKALVEKGLGKNCILIRDTVKDRRKAVESVRERVAQLNYKRFTHPHSKDQLQIHIDKARTLIETINAKHLVLDKRIFGPQVWTDVVGKLLAQLRGSKSSSTFKIGKYPFEFTPQELDRLLEITAKGEIAYLAFAPFESTAFLNPRKFQGGNPHALEQSLKEALNGYSAMLGEILRLEQEAKQEYFDRRKYETESRLDSIDSQIDRFHILETAFQRLNTSSKQAYVKVREAEFSEELAKVRQIKSEIAGIVETDRAFFESLDEKKIEGFMYRTLALFSKEKASKLAAYSKLKILVTKLNKQIADSKDLASLPIGSGVLDAIQGLYGLETILLKKEASIGNTIQSEFAALDFDTLMGAANLDERLKQIRIATRSVNNSPAFESMIDETIRTFSDSEIGLSAQCREVVIALSKLPEFGKTYKIEGSLEEKRKLVSAIQVEIESIRSSLPSNISLELSNANLYLKGHFPSNLDCFEKLRKAATAGVEMLALDAWLGIEIPSLARRTFVTDFENVIQRVRTYLGHEKDLFSIEFKWHSFYNTLPSHDKSLIDRLRNLSDWPRQLLQGYLGALLELNSQVANLPTDDGEHQELAEALKGVKGHQIKYISDYWFSAQIEAAWEFHSQNPNFTVENLYNQRSSDRFKRLSLRQIIQKDTDLFSTFFPVILTSPEVASTLFHSKLGYFDLVMFDEASQLRLEDNLPALLKGKQIIIAGDEHQMPPSNYFSKLLDGSLEDEEDEEEEEEEIVLDKEGDLLACESLLDFAGELNFEKRYLDFHYRSRHPYLIDFSNHAFYQQRLKPLPNNFEYVPIRYVSVNGTYSEHTNDAEAEMVLSILEHNIQPYPNGSYPSVGIATLNIAQRNLIKSKILDRQRFPKFADFNAKVRTLEDNGFFIKNLENIQGDERDVIILSTTYGIAKDGRFSQRFGPINLAKGYKLLNVIITRAKYKVYLCTSIPERVFLEYGSHMAKEGNTRKAVFYAYLAYCRAVSIGDNEARLAVLKELSQAGANRLALKPAEIGDLESPFEEEVYLRLTEEVGSEKVLPQVSFAGFRIDLVYDPKIEGIPKIAIECDGAKYHSSREAYLYDRHRQRILEDHGFVFHRIWSTNWWRNPSRELNNLVSFIRTVEASEHGLDSSQPNLSIAFTDEMETIETHMAQSTISVEQDDFASIETIAFEPPLIKTETDEGSVRINSKVRLKYINNGMFIDVEIVESASTKNHSGGLPLKIYFKSPLGSSILGHHVGDICKIGDLDNFVEIVKVAK